MMKKLTMAVAIAAIAGSAATASAAPIVFTTSGTVAVAAFAAPYTVTARLGEGAEPSWAPDGEYVTWNRLDETADSSGITIARSDGSDAHTLVPGSGPSWRPIIGQAEAP